MKTIPAFFHSQQSCDIKIMAIAGATAPSKLKLLVGVSTPTRCVSRWRLIVIFDGPVMVLAENPPKPHPDID